MLDIIIVGAGPAGLTAAVYARRAGKSVMILEKESFGGQIVYSPKIENYPGFLELSGSEFGEKLVDQAIHHGAEIELDEVTEIHDNGKIKSVITPRTQYLCKSVIVAAGSRHRPLGLAREDDLIGHGISYCALCDGDFFKGKDVAVVGGGNTALQNAVLLSETSKSVTIVQNLPKLTGEVSLAQILKARQNVKIICNTIVTELLGTPELTGIRIRNTANGEESELTLDGVFVAIGQMPDNKPFQGVCDLDSAGFIVADETCLTKTPGVFVAGDCRVKGVRQIATAVGDGAAASLAACRYLNSLTF